ncbi:Type 1 glutamine amidotransferase-like domain-containing protein [Bacillus atrophaeus]|uniref:Type 1 glutamine amidotransferase-like domain-containing protein n=1 Tax=Bacillus atrophaeus TaxID=1452 RepID=UPI002E22CEDE|nr:Type 1 glutamine amidotransferase-like domain-containing protein [Bacillus atrophaeus]MED1028876.1 Type 1 glutamine amidotransferase-like domain-containing protein [Bacillus atrophaeus]MED1118790.1 Type 1 glutamine amidotransferase-like domain-containing protein [Bacillus atrophaeus]MED1131886.1 Type 1 glutamine amidotransferase-like domain-containing protein [Bacillus atrophaeus]
MGTLFLSGGGDAGQTQTIDKRFVKELDKDKPLLYIPIAMDTSQFDDCFEWINSLFNPLGIRDITMWTNVKDKSIQDLDDFSAVYIGGGNTFSLLKKFIDTAFIEVLKGYTENDGIVYGGSAGAVILGKHIMTCSHMDPNHVGLNKFNGLELVKEYSIWCHYKHENDPLIKKYVKEYKAPVISLPEETGILVNDMGIQVIGTKPAYVYQGERKTVIYHDHFIK